MNDNKLIAEFMGWTPCDPNDSTVYANPTNGALHSSQHDMRFHTSWDWLMPVLKKIKLQVHPDTVGMWRKVTQPIGYDIHEVHEEAVKFIKRYGKSEKVNTLT